MPFDATVDDDLIKLLVPVTAAVVPALARVLTLLVVITSDEL
jgi:hypothetical protein